MGFRRAVVAALAVVLMTAAIGATAASAAAFAAPSGQIAFVREDYSRGSEWSQDEIWLMESDGSGVHHLVGYIGGVSDLEWSPDGRQLAILAKMPDGPPKLWLTAADGSGRREVPVGFPGTTGTYRSLSGLAWSPDGSRIALSYYLYPKGSAGPTTWILVVDLGSGDTETLVGPCDYLAYAGLAWSSTTDSLIASTSSGTGESGWLSRFRASTGAALGSIGGGQYFTFWNAPDYSPDGTRVACSIADIAAIVTGQGECQYSIATIAPADGSSSLLTIANSTTIPITTPAWSPDGQWVMASTRPVQGSHDLVIFPAAGGAAIDTGVDGWRADWRPAGPPPATRADVVTALTRLRNALLAQYARDIDLTASTYIYTSEYRSAAKITEPLALLVERLKEGLGVVSTALGVTGKSVKQLVTGKVVEDPKETSRFLDALGKVESSGEYRAVGAGAGISALIGDYRSVDEYELMPQGYGKLSKAADALRKQYKKQGLDAAIKKMGEEIENSAASPEVPLRAAAWPSGARPRAAKWALAPVQVDSAIRTLFANLTKRIPAQLPAGYDAAGLVARLDALRAQVKASGVRRVDFSDVPALQGPNQTARSIPLGLIDANWNCLSSLESAFLQKLKVRKKQTVTNAGEGVISFVTIVIAGSDLSTIVEPVLLSYELYGDLTLSPEQTEQPMTAMNENEFEMSMHLVEDLANLYEIANCTSDYVGSTLHK